MANDLNQCNFIGRLGRDPESKTFPSGDMVTNVSIAVGKMWKDRQTGEKKERTEWVSLIFSGGLAEVASQYLRKGSQIFVSTEMTVRKWQDQSGQDRYSTEFRVRDMQMLGSKDGGGQSAPQEQRQASAPRQAPPRQAASAQQGNSFEDDDIPF